MHTNDELPFILPNRLACREIAAHLRDADAADANELCRLTEVASIYGLDLAVDLHMLAGLPTAEVRAGLDKLADLITS